jgi:hypothetical protein
MCLETRHPGPWPQWVAQAIQGVYIPTPSRVFCFVSSHLSSLSIINSLVLFL